MESSSPHWELGVLDPEQPGKSPDITFDGRFVSFKWSKNIKVPVRQLGTKQLTLVLKFRVPPLALNWPADTVNKLYIGPGQIS